MHINKTELIRSTNSPTFSNKHIHRTLNQQNVTKKKAKNPKHSDLHFLHLMKSKTVKNLQKMATKDKKTLKMGKKNQIQGDNRFTRDSQQTYLQTSKNGQQITNSNCTVHWLFTSKDLLQLKKKQNFSKFVNQQDFQNLQNLKLNLLHFVVEKRLILDKQFDLLYENLVDKFPGWEKQIKEILVEVLIVLES